MNVGVWFAEINSRERFPAIGLCKYQKRVR